MIYGLYLIYLKNRLVCFLLFPCCFLNIMGLYGLDATGDRWMDVFNADWRKGIRQPIAGLSRKRHAIAMQNMLNMQR